MKKPAIAKPLAEGANLHYWPKLNDPFPFIDNEPLAAKLVMIWSPYIVEIKVTDITGVDHNLRDVFLYDGDSTRPNYGYCEIPRPGIEATLPTFSQPIDPAAAVIIGVDPGAPEGDVAATVKRHKHGTVNTVSKTYNDGTTATGIAPLPDQSPAEQSASELRNTDNT